MKERYQYPDQPLFDGGGGMSTTSTCTCAANVGTNIPCPIHGPPSDNQAIRYRLEALGWQRKYKQLQVETEERLEKLEPWMVEWLLAPETEAGWSAIPEEVMKAPGRVDEHIAAAIHHAIGGDDAQD